MSQKSGVYRKYLEAEDGSHDRERVVRAASGGTLSEDSHGEQEGSSGHVWRRRGQAAIIHPGEHRPSTGKGCNTSVHLVSSSHLGPQTWDLRGCSQRFESSLIVCRFVEPPQSPSTQECTNPPPIQDTTSAPKLFNCPMTWMMLFTAFGIATQRKHC